MRSEKGFENIGRERSSLRYRREHRLQPREEFAPGVKARCGATTSPPPPVLCGAAAGAWVLPTGPPGTPSAPRCSQSFHQPLRGAWACSIFDKGTEGLETRSCLLLAAVLSS